MIFEHPFLLEARSRAQEVPEKVQPPDVARLPSWGICEPDIPEFRSCGLIAEDPIKEGFID